MPSDISSGLLPMKTFSKCQRRAHRQTKAKQQKETKKKKTRKPNVHTHTYTRTRWQSLNAAVPLARETCQKRVRVSVVLYLPPLIFLFLSLPPAEKKIFKQWKRRARLADIAKCATPARPP